MPDEDFLEHESETEQAMVGPEDDGPTSEDEAPRMMANGALQRRRQIRPRADRGAVDVDDDHIPTGNENRRRRRPLRRPRPLVDNISDEEEDELLVPLPNEDELAVVMAEELGAMPVTMEDLMAEEMEAMPVTMEDELPNPLPNEDELPTVPLLNDEIVDELPIPLPNEDELPYDQQAWHDHDQDEQTPACVEDKNKRKKRRRRSRSNARAVLDKQAVQIPPALQEEPEEELTTIPLLNDEFEYEQEADPISSADQQVWQAHAQTLALVRRRKRRRRSRSNARVVRNKQEVQIPSALNEEPEDKQVTEICSAAEDELLRKSSRQGRKPKRLDDYM